MDENQEPTAHDIFEMLLESEWIPEDIRNAAKKCKDTHVDVATDFMTAMRHAFGVNNIKDIMDRALDYVDAVEGWTDEQSALFLTALYHLLSDIQLWYADGLHFHYGMMGPNFLQQFENKDNMFRTNEEDYVSLLGRMRKYGIMFAGDERNN